MLGMIHMCIYKHVKTGVCEPLVRLLKIREEKVKFSKENIMKSTKQTCAVVNKLIQLITVKQSENIEYSTR